MINYIDKHHYRNSKAALTRAINKAKKSETGQPKVLALKAIIALVAQTFEGWDRNDFAWPDDWSRWQRASEDAEYELRRAEWGSGY